MATRERAIPFGIKGTELNFQVVGGLPAYPEGVAPVEETIATGLTASAYNYIEYWLAGWGWQYGSTSAMSFSGYNSVHITGSTIVSMAWSHGSGMYSNSRVELMLSDNTAIELASGSGTLYNQGSTYTYVVDTTVDLSGYSAEQLSSVSVRVGLGDISAGGGATSGLRQDANLTIDSVIGIIMSAEPGPPVANPIENTIWVNTDIDITKWAFNVSQPDSPQAGDIYIMTGPNSFISFNALKENYMLTQPIATSQWDGSKWVFRDGHIYQNGEWITFFAPKNEGCWTFEKYASGASTPHPSDFVGKTVIDTKTFKDSNLSTSMAIGDSYSAMCTTYLYFDSNTTLSVSFTTDDNGSVTLNGTPLGDLTSCNAKSISCPFKAGWNELVVCFTEGSGGDGWTTNPRLYNHASVKAMYASLY